MDPNDAQRSCSDGDEDSAGGAALIDPDGERVAALAAEAAYLREMLVARECELLQVTDRLTVFTGLYNRTVGVLLLRLRGIELRIAELAVEAAPGDDGARRRLNQLRDDAAEARQAVRAAKRAPRAAVGDAVRALFRKVCRAVHPDLAPDEHDVALRERLMRDANEAYARGDGKRLQQILDMHADIAELLPDESRIQAYERIIARTTERLHQVESAIDDLTSTVQFTLMERVEAEGDAMIERLQAGVRERIDDALRRLGELR